MHAFQNYINRWYQRYGRHQLPWRQDFDPYKILVSEIMLQQTQVERVIPKFKLFMQSFPTITHLADASTAELLKHWQGLGYNRRALNLQKAAKVINMHYQNVIPQTTDELLQLPGIGPYTCSAIRAFAFNLPTTVLETNIRTVFIYHFFPGKNPVSDDKLIPLIDQSMDRVNPRFWYAALMDYGSYLKSVFPNPNRKSRSYQKQSRFFGSNRQLRGAVLRQLTLRNQLTKQQLLATMPERVLFSRKQIQQAIKTLSSEGFIKTTKKTISLAS